MSDSLIGTVTHSEKTNSLPLISVQDTQPVDDDKHETLNLETSLMGTG